MLYNSRYKVCRQLLFVSPPGAVPLSCVLMKIANANFSSKRQIWLQVSHKSKPLLFEINSTRPLCQFTPIGEAGNVCTYTDCH